MLLCVPGRVDDQGRQPEHPLKRSLRNIDMLDPVERYDRIGPPQKSAQHPQLLALSIRAHIIAPAAIDPAGEQDLQGRNSVRAWRPGR